MAARPAFQITVNDNHFFVTVPYLVDKVDSGCVLRMRPLLATENFCERVCGWGTACAANTIILGLPFLHNYCLSYDRNAMHGNIVLYEQRDPPKRIVMKLSKKGDSSQRQRHNEYVAEDSTRRDKWRLLPIELDVLLTLKLGSGAFADVYKGRLLRQGLEVAMKVAKDSTDEARSDLVREIDFMKSLGTHPHVLSMLGHTTLNGDRLALVLEYCAGGDLLNWLLSHVQCIKGSLERERCPLHATKDVTLKQLLSFAWQISDGLAYLVSKRLVHRDIAARNVLLTADFTAKISDFGLCRRSEGSVYNTMQGKLPIKWMAPEALRSGTFSEKTDVWSYGMLLYEMYSAGSLPFPHVQPYEQLGVLESGERPAKPEVCPDNVYDLMRRCWLAEPSARPTSTEAKQYLEVIVGSSSSSYGYFDFHDVEDMSEIVRLPSL
ncbi:TK/KIN6 protein kinase [Aphelenchoides avenae]|nr:TK/KIN6 protein kinase [Aphelenchus avenae]